MALRYVTLYTCTFVQSCVHHLACSTQYIALEICLKFYSNLQYASKKPVRIYSALLSSFSEVLHVYIACTRTTVEDHGCTGKGRHATRTTTSRLMPLLLLYHAPSFGCSSFSVYRGLVQEPFDRRAWAYTMLYMYVNLCGPQLLYSARKFGQVYLTRAVHPVKKVFAEKFCLPM